MLHFTRTMVVAAPIARVFAFHLDTRNAARIAPPFPRLTIVAVGTPPVSGETIQQLRIHIGPWGMPYEALVTDIEPPGRVVDIQKRGPFAMWWHEHRFEALGLTSTRLTDTVRCALPWYLGGPLIDQSVVRLQLGQMFAYRHRITKAILENPREPVWLTPPAEVDAALAAEYGLDREGNALTPR